MNADASPRTVTEERATPVRPDREESEEIILPAYCARTNRQILAVEMIEQGLG